MKRNTGGHPKTADLKARLGLRSYQVMGVLEALWHFAAQYAKRGDCGKFTDSAIAQGIEWDRDPVELIAALVGAGYLDRCACHRLRIHDWPDHADQTVTRSKEVQRLGFLDCYQHAKLAASARGGDESEKLAGQARQPLPLPLPSPLPEPEPEPLPGPGAPTDGRAGAAWAAVVGRVRSAIPDASWNTWLRPTVGVGIDARELRVSVPSPAFVAWIGRNYGQHLSAAMEAEGLANVRLVFAVSRRAHDPPARAG